MSAYFKLKQDYDASFQDHFILELRCLCQSVPPVIIVISFVSLCAEFGGKPPEIKLCRAFSHDVKTAAMFVYQANPVGFELFSYLNTFFFSNKFA